MGIILPESLFGNPTYGYVVEYLKQHVKFLGLVSLPEELFQPYTHNKTCAVFLERKPSDKISDTEDYPIMCRISSLGTKLWKLRNRYYF
jgi:type I restriction enzyme M protein